MLAAPVPEIEAAIAGVTWPELKAPRIQAILRAVAERHGSLSLDFLAGWMSITARALAGGDSRGRAEDQRRRAVVQRPADAALPVDSHHHRVAQRTGLIGAKVDVGPSHPILRAQLPADWSAQALYDTTRF